MGLGAGDTLTVYGFGEDESGSMSDTLRSVALARVPRSQCTQYWGSIQVHNDLCAIGGCVDGKCGDTCSGDSGGATPLPRE